MSKISKVIARQVFDSRGNPTIETEVFVKDISASAICPSGASTGTYEAFEKRDINNKKYLGKSVLKPVEFINKVISKKLKNFNVHQQEKIDNLLIRLDGTKQKKKVGANAILSVSIAVKKLSSKIKKIPIYKNLLINKNFKFFEKCNGNISPYFLKKYSHLIIKKTFISQFLHQVIWLQLSFLLIL